MISNREVIYEFKEMTDKHAISDNTGWSDEWIFFYLLRIRANIIHQKSKAQGRVEKFNEMLTPCMELEEIPSAECPFDYPSNCIILKTKLPTPQSVTGILAVGNADFSQHYSQVSFSKLKYKLNSRFPFLASKSIWYSKDEGTGTYIYVASQKNLKLIKALMIPDNPLDIQTMPGLDGKITYPCKSYYDYEWKLDSDLTRIVLDIALTKIRERTPISDIKNNSIDDNIGNKQELIGNNS